MIADVYLDSCRENLLKEKKRAVINAINGGISDLGVRMMVRHFLDGCEIDDIARFAGTSPAVVLSKLSVGNRCLSARLGIGLEQIRAEYHPELYLGRSGPADY